MRRGQRAGAAPELRIDDTGRILLTARYAAELSKRPISTIRARRGDPTRGEAGPVACHIATGALYWDAEALKVKLPDVAVQHRRRNVGRKGIVGHAAPVSRTVT